MQTPMLYKEPTPVACPPVLAALLQRLSQFELRFISHARHRWCNTGDFEPAEWEQRYSKHNNWIIHAYAEFRRRHSDVRSVLVLLEYGTDVARSKQLCQELGVADAVLWIGRDADMQLLEVISACDVGIGGVLFRAAHGLGRHGVGKSLACGKPLVQKDSFLTKASTKLCTVAHRHRCALSATKMT